MEVGNETGNAFNTGCTLPFQVALTSSAVELKQLDLSGSSCCLCRACVCVCVCDIIDTGYSRASDEKPGGLLCVRTRDLSPAVAMSALSRAVSASVHTLEMDGFQ